MILLPRLLTMSHTLPSVPGGLDSVYFQERPGNPQDTQKPLCLQGAREKRLQPNLEKAGSAPGRRRKEWNWWTEEEL